MYPYAPRDIRCLIDLPLPTLYQALEVVAGLGVKGDKDKAADQIKALYKLFTDLDCTMVEVNPLAEDAQGNLVAADAKVRGRGGTLRYEAGLRVHRDERLA